MHAELGEAECDQGSKTNNNTKTTLFNVQPSYQTNQLALKYAIFVLGLSMSVSVN